MVIGGARLRKSNGAAAFSGAKTGYRRDEPLIVNRKIVNREGRMARGEGRKATGVETVGVRGDSGCETRRRGS